jgi:ABC-2 type transport system ATP-binding protein
VLPIHCEGLTRRYGDVVALDHLDLEVQPGSVFGFLGPNGAGKSTTIKLLTGLIRPTSGRAWVNGVEVTLEDSPARAQFGYLPEDPTFYGWMSAREALRFLGGLFGIAPKELNPRIEELLELLDLKTAAKRRVGGFSRGMRQRLGVAQALLNRPPVLFLDEPASALDPMGRRDVLGLIEKLKERGDTTIFMSTHILADVERVCDTIGIIDKGRLRVVAHQDDLRQRYATPLFEVELEGDGNGAGAALCARLETIPWVERVVREGARLRVFVRDADAAKRELPGLVTQSGGVLLRYQMMLPTLEDVFVRLLGDPAPAQQTAEGQAR